MYVFYSEIKEHLTIKKNQLMELLTRKHTWHKNNATLDYYLKKSKEHFISTFLNIRKYFIEVSANTKRFIETVLVLTEKSDQ